MKVQKIVSLTPETAKIAQELPNFSGWVRKKLKAHDLGMRSDKDWRQLCQIWMKVCQELSDDHKLIQETFNRITAEVEN